MRQARIRATLATACLMLLSGCMSTRLTTQAQLPPPLIDQLPLRVGIHYSKEFREYIHKETRGSIDYEINLGPAHVTNLDWLLKAMFAEVVPIEDPTTASVIQPPLVLVLEPKFEEYSFLTPKDVAGEAFIVTIRYMLALYDGSGARVDSFTLTGYGREKARAMTNKEPLQVATQRAMRDAGAKVAVELTDQESVRLLIRNAGSFPPNVVPVTIQPASESPVAGPQATEPPPADPPADEPPAEQEPAGQSPAAEVPPSGSGL